LKRNVFPITALFYGCFIAFMVWYIRSLDWRTLEGLTVTLWPLALATVLGLLFRYCGVITWMLVLKGLGAEKIENKAAMAHVYAKSWLGRYLPGKVTWILGKVYFASLLGIPKRNLAVASVFEGALQAAVVLFLSLCLLALDPRLDVFAARQKMLLILGSIALLAVMLPAVFNPVIGFVYRRLRGEPFPLATKVTNKTLISAFGLNALGFVLSGVGYFFFTMAIHADLQYDHIFFVVGAFNLAGAVGIISIFAPGGLGVREGIQLLLLPLVMPAEVALVVTVAARLWSLWVDLLFFGVTSLHIRITPGVRAGSGDIL
jgi:glycosyltransferase 2 family protein